MNQTNFQTYQSPPSRLIREGTIGSCPVCHSTEVRKYGLFGKKIGCVQPKCENYYRKGGRVA